MVRRDKICANSLGCVLQNAEIASEVTSEAAKPAAQKIFSLR